MLLLEINKYSQRVICNYFRIFLLSNSRGEIPTKNVALEIKSLSDLKILNKYPQYWKDTASFLVLDSTLFSTKDIQGLNERLKQLNFPIHINPSTWRFTSPKYFRDLEDPDSSLIGNRRIEFYIQNYSRKFMLDTWMTAIFDDQDFEFVDNWFAFQKDYSDILLRRKIPERPESLRQRVIKKIEEKSPKDEHLTSIESYSLPYIPVMKLADYRSRETELALNGNIEIIDFFTKNYSKEEIEKTCPSIVINFEATKVPELDNLIDLIKNNFINSWVWFVDIHDISITKEKLISLWKFLKKINQNNKRIFRLRLGSYLSQRFLNNEFNTICSFIDGWGSRNFSFNYMDEDPEIRRTKHIFHPQKGTFVSSKVLIKEINIIKNEFRCNCLSCQSLDNEANLTIPEMELKRFNARKEEKRLNKAEIGVSQSKQSEFVKIHDLIMFHTLCTMSNDQFDETLGECTSSGIKKWLEVKKIMEAT